MLLQNNVKALLEGYLAIVQGRWADEDHEFVVDHAQANERIAVL